MIRYDSILFDKYPISYDRIQFDATLRLLFKCSVTNKPQDCTPITKLSRYNEFPRLLVKKGHFLKKEDALKLNLYERFNAIKLLIANLSLSIISFVVDKIWLQTTNSLPLVTAVFKRGAGRIVTYQPILGSQFSLPLSFKNLLEQPSVFGYALRLFQFPFYPYSFLPHEVIVHSF
jgi:hypothetical protein